MLALGRLIPLAPFAQRAAVLRACALPVARFHRDRLVRRHEDDESAPSHRDRFARRHRDDDSLPSSRDRFVRRHNDDDRASSHRQHQHLSVGNSSNRHREPASEALIGRFAGFRTTFEHTEAPPLAWADVEGLSPATRRALNSVFKYEECSPVQAALLQHGVPLSRDRDFLVQAKTGTGKTLAFLVPAIDAITKPHPLGKECRVLIVSPTRELATQIADEARRLTTHSRLSVQCLVGGESKFEQRRRLHRGRCDVVVGTPGRLLDMIESNPDFERALKGVQTLILDEADRMLEIGFKQDIETIVEALPQGDDRPQTLCFSATYPRNVQDLVASTLRPGYAVLNTISPNDVSTVERIAQSYLVTPLEKQLPLLHALLHRGLFKGDAFKCIVFLPTTRMVELAAELFRLALGNQRFVYELHGRIDQRKRTRVSAKFRAAERGVLFTSDVSARGVDYPNVQLVVQVGVPGSPEDYAHRIGRTGRAGREGHALLMLAPFERPFLDELRELPLTQCEVVDGCPEVGPESMRELKWNGSKSHEIVATAAQSLEPQILEDAFLANLGFYQSQIDSLRRLSRGEVTGHSILKELSKFVQALGLEEVPTIPQRLRPSFSEPRPRSRSLSRPTYKKSLHSLGGGHRPWDQRGSRSASPRERKRY